MARQAKKKEFLYWKAVFLETRANGIPDDTIMGILAKTQPAFDEKTTKTQLKAIKTAEKPYTDPTLRDMFNIPQPLPDKTLNEAWVSIARDLIDTHDIITMSDTKQMMVRQGNIYIDKTDAVEKELSDQIIESYHGKSYDHKVKAARNYINHQTRFDRDEFCYDRWIINFANGYYDIKKNKFIKAEDNKDKIFCYEIPHEYHSEKADCPYFKQLLVEWLEEDNIVKPDDIFEMIGYSMTMTTHLKMAFMIYGKSNTGKTAFQNILSYLIGIRNISGTPLHRFGSNEFGTDNLQFKILNMVGDMGETIVEELSVFKNLTGGDVWVHAEYKGGKKFEFRNMVKIWNNVNYIPKVINKHDEAFFNRWTLINFKHIFDMYDSKTIKEIWIKVNDDPAEIQGIIHECIKGCKRLLKRNEYFRQELLDNTKHTWEYESDQLYAFKYDNCIQTSDATVGCSEFRNEFNKFLYRKKRAKVSAYKLNDMLETIGVFRTRGSTDDDRSWYYEGIGWKPQKILEQQILR